MSNDIVAIDRIRRVWMSMTDDHNAANMLGDYKSFEVVRDIAQQTYSGCSKVTAGAFFEYLRETEQASSASPVDSGDFDDMGCSRIAGGYHHDQKRARGRF